MGKRLLSAPLLCLLAATAAQAQVPAGGAQAGSATRAEMIAKLDESFARVDGDKSGSIEQRELETLEAKAAEELQAGVHKRLADQFARLDADKNGQLSLAEFQAGAKVRSNAKPGAAMQRLDTNKDGKVSRDEYRARQLGIFDSLDANKDGTVTAAEAAKGSAR